MWLIVAGGATFAAFPEWYATLFSGFYLPLLLILRGADRARRRVRVPRQGRRAARGSAAGTCASSSAAWCRRCCGASRSATSCAACRSTRSTSTSARFFALLNPYALLGGLTTLALFALHGAVFLALKTDGEIRARAGRLAARLWLAAVVLAAAAFLLWTQLAHGDAGRRWRCPVAAAVALVGGVVARPGPPRGLGVRGDRGGDRRSPSPRCSSRSSPTSCRHLDGGDSA